MANVLPYVIVKIWQLASNWFTCNEM